jgi:hypothetical protein
VPIEEIDFDASFVDRRVNLRSRRRALSMLFLSSDVGMEDAPTRIRTGSRLHVARLLEPFGEEGIGGDTDLSVTDGRPEALATGPQRLVVSFTQEAAPIELELDADGPATFRSFRRVKRPSKSGLSDRATHGSDVRGPDVERRAEGTARPGAGQGGIGSLGHCRDTAP